MDASHPATAVAVFEDRAHAVLAVQALRQAGFDDRWVKVVTENRNVATAGKPVRPSRISLTGEGTLIGAVTGGALGLLTGVGLWTGIIPMWPTMAATQPGLLVLTFTLCGLVIGGLVGALVGFGQPEQEARFYGEAIEAGHPVVTVDADSRYVEAMNILHQYGGHERLGTTPPAELNDL